MRQIHFTRRQFLKTALAGMTSLAIAGKAPCLPASAQSTPPPIHLPILMKSSGAVDLRGRVIHIYSPSVSNWDFNSSHYYGRTQATGVVGVSQAEIDAMIDRGVTALLGLQPDALVDLNSNPHINNKTVLVLGDGIYGSRQYQDTPPERWSTFGNASPCSLFFAADPVAIDCVMHDLLKAERGAAQPATSNAYLRLAESAGLGIYESGNPWQLPYDSGYTKITYLYIDA